MDQLQDLSPDGEDDKPQILVVDDSPDNVRLLSRMLETAGYDVHSVTDGQEALLAARNRSPALILLDIMMPGMSGYDVCEHLRADENTRDIPIIFLSALSTTQDKVKAFAMGGVDYITKPFHVREVLARVATHVALRELRTRLEAANRELERRNDQLEKRNQELQEALDAIETLSGLIPICAWCGRKIEDQSGQWIPVETYIEAHSEATFTHSMCPDCHRKMKAQAEQVLRTDKTGGRAQANR